MADELVKVQHLSLADTKSLASIFVKSGFFQDSRDEAQAVVKILAGREMGFGPFASMAGINIIKGKVAQSANLIAAAIKRSGRYNFKVTSHTDTGCSLEFSERGSASWVVVGVSTFTQDDAKRAGLGGANYNNFPRNMYFARALTNGARWYCADIFAGPVYTPDELGAEVDGETGEIVTPAPEPVPERTFKRAMARSRQREQQQTIEEHAAEVEADKNISPETAFPQEHEVEERRALHLEAVKLGKVLKMTGSEGIKLLNHYGGPGATPSNLDLSKFKEMVEFLRAQVEKVKEIEQGSAA